MKKLSDFKDAAGIVVASKVLAVIMDMLSDKKNFELKGEENVVKMFTAFMANSPDKMREIFAILSEKDVSDYHCDGAEAMANMLMLANDPIVVGLFTLQSQMGDAISSGSVSENTEAQTM
jgi:CHASE3 domain sensor protein